MLVECCWRERRTIMGSSISSHHSYNKRMPLSFNKEIQSSYYQNTLVSVEGVSLECVDVVGTTHTRFLGHWSDNSKHDTTETMQIMHCKLCIDGDTKLLVNGLMVGGTVWKGMDGATTLYNCGKNIYGQGKLSAELHITINAQVKALEHSKWWLDGKKPVQQMRYQMHAQGLRQRGRRPSRYLL
jgi:hypothetical protein